MIIKVAVNGALGRMGQETVQTLESDPQFDLVGAFTHDDDLEQSLRQTKPDVVVDFTHPDSVYPNLLTMIRCNVHPVIGTTGLTAEQIETATEQCAAQKLGAIIAPNFSLGALLLIRMAELAAPYFPDVEIIEYHHPAKKDAPSGTAIKTARAIDERRNAPMVAVKSQGPARGETVARTPIHAVRLPGFVAAETVIFGAPYETLTIQHNSLDRQSFMPGVVMACKKVMELERLVYGLESLLV